MKAILFGLFAIAASSAMASSLCNTNETPLFECQKNARQYALCASKDLSATAGSLQYRAAINGRNVFLYPADLNKSATKFSARMTGSGVEVDFSNNGYDYSLSTDARDNDTITVNTR